MRNPHRRTGMWTAGCLALLLSATASASDRGSSNQPSALSSDPVLAKPELITVPGPLRSLLRMAGISQKIPPESVLPLLARSVYFLGYRQGHETEFLLLLQRYIHQARELEALAGPKRRDSNRSLRGSGSSASGARLQYAQPMRTPGRFSRHFQCGPRFYHHRLRFSSHAPRTIAANRNALRVFLLAVPGPGIAAEDRLD